MLPVREARAQKLAVELLRGRHGAREDLVARLPRDARIHFCGRVTKAAAAPGPGQLAVAGMAYADQRRRARVPRRRRDEGVEALEGVAGPRPDVEAVHAARRLGARGRGE